MSSPVRMITMASRLAFTLALWAIVSAGAQAQTLRTVVALKAPAEMLSAYTCAGVALEYIGPEIEKRAVDALKSGRDRRAVVRELLQDYDDKTESMCRAILPLFQRQPDLIFDAFARQVPAYTANQEPWLLNPRTQRWLKETNEFQANTASLFQMYQLMMKLAPELSRFPPGTVRSEAQFAGAEKASTFTYFGGNERAQLILALGDTGFATVAPRRFQLPALAAQEQGLRSEALALHGRGLLWGPTDALFHTRVHFQGRDGMRSMGLIEVMKSHIDRIRGTATR
ncbi:hypothetical protein [Massilia sp. DWR3-1-1]|uniref:hypothetical protein n=1 Tax=Massilia sp. DWR3-1-1 TaxID=2804559 RepID=UPI003CEF3CA4